MRSKPLALAWRRKVFGRDDFTIVVARELFGALPDQQHIRRAFHHRARRFDRIAHDANARDRARIQGAPAHNRGVEFVAPIENKESPPRAAGKCILKECNFS